MALIGQGKNTLCGIMGSTIGRHQFMDFIFSTMAKETRSVRLRTLMNNWLQTSPKDAARPETVYNDILGHLSIKIS